MKKIIFYVVVSMYIIQLLPTATAEKMFDLIDVSITDDNVIQIEFNDSVGSDNPDKIYFLDENDEKVSADSKIDSENDCVVLVEYPTVLQNVNAQLIINGALKSADGIGLSDAYMYDISQSSIDEDFSDDIDWSYVKVHNMSPGTETVNEYLDVTTVDGKLTDQSVVNKEGVIIPDKNLESFNANTSTVELTVKPVAVSDGTASMPQIFTNLTKIKRPAAGEYTNSQWQLHTNGYSISMSWGNLILHRYTYENISKESVINGGGYASKTKVFSGGYKADCKYRIKMTTINSDDAVTIEVYIAPVKDDGTWEFGDKYTYTDYEPISTSGSFGISHWSCGNGWEIDDFKYYSQISLGEMQKASNYVKLAEEIIESVITTEELPENLQDTIVEVNAIIKKLEKLGFNANDIAGYDEFQEKCEEFLRFELKEVYPDGENADVLVLKFNHPVNENLIDECIYMATDDRTVLDADVYMDSQDNKQVMIRIPVDFKETEASIVIKENLKSKDGNYLHEGRVIRIGFNKKYDDFSVGDNGEWMTAKTTNPQTNFDDLEKTNKNMNIADSGYFNDNGFLFDTAYKENVFDNTIVETEFYGKHANMNGLILMSRVSNLSSGEWKFGGNAYTVAWYGSSVWIAKSPNSKNGYINDAVGYSSPGRMASSGYKFSTDTWYKVRFVTTTLEDESVKLDLYIAQRDDKYSDEPLISYIDIENPLTDAGVSAFWVSAVKDDDGNNYNSIHMDYYSMSSAPEIIEEYSFDEIKLIAEEKIQNITDKEITNEDKSEVVIISDTIEFLKENGIAEESINGYSDFLSIKEEYPYVKASDMLTSTENFTINIEFSHDMDMSTVSDNIELYKDSVKMTDYETELEENKVSFIIYNDRNYDSVYEININGKFARKNGLSLGTDYSKCFEEKAPVFVQPPEITKENNKIKVQTKVVSDDSSQSQDYSLLIAVMTKTTDEEGRIYYKTEEIDFVSCVSGMDITTDFSAVDGEMIIYTALYETETGLDILYKGHTVVVE